ncbi:DUF92 domain-containing protein [candidate division KSB1 bacterium]|nr:DUF92 domain-containing protein [candidate division KSB1 bacterium]RQW06396.1 MAG: DUF92 domain-containing protein [candidate division KSB1 bacterium]
MARSDWFFLVLFTVLLFLIVLIAELLRRTRGWPPETTRKIVHVVVGVMVATTPFVLHSMWPMVILGVLFAVIDFFAVRRGILNGMHGTRRHTYGTVFYPISFVILTVTLWDNHKLILVTAMLIMAISDAVAAIVGERAKKPIVLQLGPETKSVQGSAAMLLTTFLLVIISCQAAVSLGYYDLSLARIVWIAAIVGIMAMASEVISMQGSDNLTVPLASAFAMFYLLTESPHDGLIFTLGMCLALVIALVSYRLHFLDGGGAVALLLLGTLVFGVGRWTFSVPILAFFILSSLLSKMGKRRKTKLQSVFEKSGRRDAAQVLANGGVAGLLLILWYFLQRDYFYVLYVASLAAVTADTWATEIGVMARRQPRSVLTFKPVPMGTSGGISLLGMVGSALGASIIVLFGFIFSPHTSPRLFGYREAGLVLLAGVLAGLVDSYLGATVQAQFQCPLCGKMTEKRHHCDGRQTTFIRGYLWINNDVVNGLCAASAVLIVWIADLLIR